MMHRTGLQLPSVLGASLIAAAGSVWAGPVEDLDRERVYREEALAHANAITTAWRRLEDHIRLRASTPETWANSIPPAQTGWLPVWTQRGLRARWCDGILLVYLEPAVLKGVGTDHHSVQVAPHLYTEGRARGRMPVLHRLADGMAEGGVGRPTIALPNCMAAPVFGVLLPTGHAALAGRVPDPFRVVRTGISYENRTEPCPAGQHGTGRTMRREIQQDYNARSQPTGSLRPGAWRLAFEDCPSDRVEWQHFTRPCRWMAGPPHNREMTGREIWRRQKRMSADGVSYGTPEFVSTTCWTVHTPVMPQPNIRETSWVETAFASCPAHQTGRVVLTRTIVRRATRFPWDDAPVVQVRPGSWNRDDSGCVDIPEEDEDPDDGMTDPADPDEDAVHAPDQPPGDGEEEQPVDETPENEDSEESGDDDTQDSEPDDDSTDVDDDAGFDDGDEDSDGGEGGDDGNDDSSDSEPDDDSTDVDDDAGFDDGDEDSDGGEGGDDGNDDSSDSEPDDDSTDVDDDAGFDDGDEDSDDDESDGDDGDGDDGCFLTTAVVKQRGLEPDNGPTLTTLRQFRDGYMTRSPELRGLVSLYYEISPHIASDIPGDHPEWVRIGRDIDAAVQAVRDGREDAAFVVYARLMSRLADTWHPEGAARVRQSLAAAGHGRSGSEAASLSSLEISRNGRTSPRESGEQL